MITTNVSHGGNFYVFTYDPAGAWSEPIWVQQAGIDPSLCFDGEHVYLTGSDGWPQPSIYQCEIDIKSGHQLTETRLLWHGTGGRNPEGPHLYHLGDWYYLLIAEGGTEYGHMETLARSRSSWGPFEPCPHNPIQATEIFLTIPAPDKPGVRTVMGIGSTSKEALCLTGPWHQRHLMLGEPGP